MIGIVYLPMSSGSVGGEGSPRRVQAWIYLIDNRGMIINQVKVPWPKIKKIFFEAKGQIED